VPGAVRHRNAGFFSRLNSSDIIEADLHRVFSDAQIRAALLACCPGVIIALVFFVQTVQA